MKTAVVGAGAMGSLFGALLAEAGNEVWLYDVWEEHVRAVNQNGLQVEREGKTRNVRMHAALDPARIGRADLVIIFVKSSQTHSAGRWSRGCSGRAGCSRS